MATEIIMPRLSDSMEEGTIVAWLVGEGDRVEQGQPLVEVETDKATVTYEADEAGVILALHARVGDTVPVGAPIAVLGAAGERVAGEPLAGAGATRQTEHVGATRLAERTSIGARTGRAVRAKASPLARRLAAELNIDLAGLAGSGPQGRVTRADVERAAGGNGKAAGEVWLPAPTPAAAPAAPGSEGAPWPSAKGDAATHELTRLQQTVARRMAESRATVPDIELRVEVDMGEAVVLRERLREVADPAPSINDLIVKATALALREHPRVNGSYRDSRFETFSRVNVGIAVATDDALVVPTIFDADQKSLGEIGASARALAERVRDGSISPAELSGGTFTVSNLGMYGVDSFSAVINPPQAAILAVGALRRRPFVDEGSGGVVARPTIVLALACDHRIVYGVDGARFLAAVRELLERPYSLLL